MSDRVALVELTCRECRYTFVADVTNEMYDNDYSIICEGCDKEQKLSYYDYHYKMRGQ